jgi:hypothetical protein
MNVIDPVGVPEPGATAVTVAVNVTGVPYEDGLSDDVRPVLVFDRTVCVRVDDVAVL